MKFNILPLAVVSAGLLASANPMRVVIVSPNEHVESGPVAQIVRPADAAHAHLQPLPIIPMPIPVAGAAVKKGCAGARWRQKATSIADVFRLALGFGATEHEHKHHAQHPHGDKAVHADAKTPGGDLVKILPFPFQDFGAAGSPSEPAHHRFRHHKHGGERPSFLMRVHFALMSLGPWEGRAVAFVLGCGIGVLLRMAFVLTVLAFRAFRPARPELDEYTVIEVLESEDADAEEIFVAPPMYTYPVEKVEVEAAPVPAQQ